MTAPTNPFRPGDVIESHGWTVKVVGPDWIVYRRSDGSVGSTANLTGLTPRSREGEDEPARYVVDVQVDLNESRHLQHLVTTELRRAHLRCAAVSQ